MITLKPKHPKFDMGMEILASLPICSLHQPAWAFLRDLVVDLGFHNTFPLRTVVEKLQREGTPIRTGSRDGGHVVYLLDSIHSRTVQHRAELYLKEVYGD